MNEGAWLTDEPSSVTYDWIAETAKINEDFAHGLRVAALVCKAHSNYKDVPCPPGILGYYLNQLAAGELP